MNSKLTDSDMIDMINKMRACAVEDEVIADWLDLLKANLSCPHISELVFHGDGTDSAEDIIHKARQYRPIQL